MMTRNVFLQLFFTCFLLLFISSNAFAALTSLVDNYASQHPGESGAYVLEKGEEALLARAWIADHAEKSIDVQYFIWSTDNIGILAAEALLRAAKRGVKVRVIVDDLLIDADDKTMVALASHPNVTVRIFNPKYSVGTGFIKRFFNLVLNFRNVNKRMHNKTFIADNALAITGGRNMADEYFDFDKEYNFRDRDVLVAGPVVANMTTSFEDYWQHENSVDVLEILEYTRDKLTSKDIEAVYQELHNYALQEENFESEIRTRITRLTKYFPEITTEMIWTNIHFVSDDPIKNNTSSGFGGGGKSTHTLANLLRDAKQKVLIQSPYVVFTDEAYALFNELLEKGIEIKISTNSLSATDNLPAFSGYNKQRKRLVEMGIKLYEYKDSPVIQKSIMQRYKHVKDYNPVFAIHAKTMVIDDEVVYIGTYNLDPRSQNLNTEAGVYLYNKKLATEVADSIQNDISAANSWDVSRENPNQHTGIIKRTKNFLLRFLPINPIL